MENETRLPNTNGMSTGVVRLKSVHQCAYCGAIVERDEVSEDEMITGTLKCHECGRSGPLKVVVVDA